MRAQVAIVGAGPAGLAAAIELARRGLRVVVCEQRATPPDKACGEGVMPAGVRALAHLGVRDLIGADDCHLISEIRYIQEDGTVARGRLPAPGGLGVRRTALAAALAQAAADSGVDLLWNCRVKGYNPSRQMMRLQTSTGPIEAELLVAADGLHSPLRRMAGLAKATGDSRRFGLRRHFRRLPPGPWVEVHLAADLQAFVTPAGSRRVGVAFLWDRSRLAGPARFEVLLARFPRLIELLADAEPESGPRGAGPLQQAVHDTVQDRLVLIGDAAGYVDAITGEGMSLAFESAAVLGAMAPAALARGADRAALQPYARAQRRAFQKYARVTRAVLAIARRPRLRRNLIRQLALHPGLLDRLICWGLS